MSIATLKRKTNSTYKVNSGKATTNPFVINMRGAGDISSNILTDSGAGFSLNGQYRNRSYIGKTYAFSNRPGQAGNYCCADNSHTIKPSVKSSRAVMNNSKLWFKRPFTSAELSGNPLPTHGKLQFIYNNWVQTGINGGILGSSTNIANTYNYVYERRNRVALCNTDRNTAYATRISTAATCTDSNNRQRRQVFPYTKFNKVIPPSSKYMLLYKTRRAGNLDGYNKPFPFTSPLDGCVPIYKQANDPIVLSTYYQAGNAVSSDCQTLG